MKITIHCPHPAAKDLCKYWPYALSPEQIRDEARKLAVEAAKRGININVK